MPWVLMWSITYPIKGCRGDGTADWQRWQPSAFLKRHPICMIISTWLDPRGTRAAAQICVPEVLLGRGGGGGGGGPHRCRAHLLVLVLVLLALHWNAQARRRCWRQPRRMGLPPLRQKQQSGQGV